MKKSNYYKYEIERINNKIQTNKEKIEDEKVHIREAEKYVESMISENQILEQVTNDYANLIAQETN